MNKGFFDPPAIVRTDKRCRADLETFARSAWSTYSHHGRKLLESGRELGEVLAELHEGCADGEWLPLLQKLGIPRRTASRLVAQFKVYPKATMGQVAHSGQDVEEELAAHIAAPEAEQKPAPPPPPVAPANKPWPDDNRCRDCRVGGRNDAACKACQELNGSEGTVGSSAPAPPPDPEEPEPGPWQWCKACNDDPRQDCSMCKLLNGREMSEEETEEHFGQEPTPPPSLIKKVEAAYKGLWRLYREIGKQFGLAVGKSVADPINHPSMRELIAAHADLKERIKKFVWAHQRKRQGDAKRQHK